MLDSSGKKYSPSFSSDEKKLYSKPCKNGASNKKLCTNDGVIYYILTRKATKNINIRISTDGLVSVSAPKSLPQSYIDKCILEKSNWIISQQEKQSHRIPLQSPPASDEMLMRFKNALQELWKTVAHDGIPYPSLALYSGKTRWGVCYPSKKKICLNTALFGLDDDLLNYVILHELTHFLHPNHSRDFWAYLSLYMPDWKSRREKLSRYKIFI